MSANPPQKPTDQQYVTEEDEKAQWASVLWFDTLTDRGILVPYEKQYIAIYDKRIIAAAPTSEELGRRLDAMGDTIPQFRVVVRYVRGFDDPL